MKNQPAIHCFFFLFHGNQEVVKYLQPLGYQKNQPLLPIKMRKTKGIDQVAQREAVAEISENY
ncbi:hypothetical protein [Brevibacillus formosus]|uniref:hypothetical protein n=1 Tax=Brevibacillus formosus TaxID=54913 RepID=UPI003D20ABD0